MHNLAAARHTGWADLSPTMHTAIIVLAIVEVAVILTGLIVWYRTAPEVMPGPNRWLWLVIVICGQLIGAPIFLLVRHQKIINLRGRGGLGTPPTQGTSEDRAAHTVNMLYGDTPDPE